METSHLENCTHSPLPHRAMEVDQVDIQELIQTSPAGENVCPEWFMVRIAATEPAT